MSCSSILNRQLISLIQIQRFASSLLEGKERLRKLRVSVLEQSKTEEGMVRERMVEINPTLFCYERSLIEQGDAFKCLKGNPFSIILCFLCVDKVKIKRSERNRDFSIRFSWVMDLLKYNRFISKAYLNKRKEKVISVQ